MADHRPGAWLQRFHPAPEAKHTLVCFPHAGGSASFWFPLSAALNPRVDVLAVQFPGRENRLSQAPVSDMKSLVDGVFTALRGGWSGQLAFIGHSMGAVVAFEVARRMETELEAGPEVLVASASRAPSLPPQRERLHNGDDETVLTAVMALGGTDPGLRADSELMQLLLPAIRSDLQAMETHRVTADAILTCPIVAFAGGADPEVTPADAQAWRAHTTGEFAFQEFPGGHFYLTSNFPLFTARITNVLRSLRSQE